MGINVNNNRPVEQNWKIEETPVQKSVSQEGGNQNPIEPANLDSKLGESSYYGLLRKDSLLKSWTLQSNSDPNSRLSAQTTSVGTNSQPLPHIDNQRIDKNNNLFKTLQIIQKI